MVNIIRQCLCEVGCVIFLMPACEENFDLFFVLRWFCVREASGWTIVEVGTEMFARPSPKCQQEEKKRFVCAQRDVPRILRLDFKEETWTGDDAEQHLPLVPCSGELVSGLESADMAPGATSNHLQQVYSYLRYLGSLDVGGSSQS
eukprot:GHVT01078615.1.p1 GENE.GHVT01078615.1~~GHVT01078615.1.p1  ORF type:complete len:146 (-),score=6.79 GHVT01078615.1:233-670(-)